VLGPVVGWDSGGAALDLKGARHRAVLARLAAARGRVVPLDVLIEDMWQTPPAGAAGAIRTFVGALRRAIEPDRPPRAASRILVTQGPGYALRTEPGDLDARRFEGLVAESVSASPSRVLELAGQGLDWWRGPAYAEFAEEPWAAAERARLTELRLGLVERQAEARLALGLAAQAVPDLNAHVLGQPWREDAWRLLALALYRSERQAEALDVIRRARALLAAELGLDPGPQLAALESDILRHAGHLDSPAGDVWAVTAAAYQRAAPALTRTRLESAATLAGSLALAGGNGLETAMGQRLAAIEDAERLGDPRLTARVIGNFDVPAIWTRSDDPVIAAKITAAAERTLTALPEAAGDPLRARLLTTIALESRGSPGSRAAEAATEAEAIARRLGDDELLAFTLGGVWMQTFTRTGLAAERDAIGSQILALSVRHCLVTYEILGRLIRLQALGGLGRFAEADAQATALDHLGELHERPLVSVFTGWYRAMRAAATTADVSSAEERYRRAALLLDGSGMPGVERGLLPLALLCLRVWRREPPAFPSGTDWGPYQAWVRPWLFLARDRPDEARNALRICPAPPRGLLTEALWCLTARAAVVLEDRAIASEAYDALLPAGSEIAGAGSGMLTAGPVRDYLTDLQRLDRNSHHLPLCVILVFHNGRW
jgi:DNA-binding SARP family transcriptional activator